MKPPDNHVHSQWSWDSPTGSSMAHSCERALAAGLPAVAFTEHLDFTDWGEGDNPAGDRVQVGPRPRVMPLDVEGYLHSIERCRERFPDLRILTGIEAGEPHLFPASVAAVLAAGQFDRVLGSLHSLTNEHNVLVGCDGFFSRMAAADVMRRYLNGIVDLINGSDVFQVLAHCDFPRRRWPRSAGEYEEKQFEDEYRQVFAALAGTGRALEINTRSPLWSSTLMRWWYEAGGGAVSFGSDAHEAMRVGARFDLAVDIVEAAGFRPGRDPLDFWRR
jgi:histidinol-phosphatase (PHP family)